MRLILASSSPARLQLLRAAGLTPIVHAPGVDESGVRAAGPEELVTELARRKGEAVFDELGAGTDTAIIACDSVLALAGEIHGKPYTDAMVRERWRLMRGRTGHLVTGHHLIVVRDGQVHRDTRPASTAVTFADITDAEIEAYLATGEPHHCAGAFTIDGVGGAFVARIDGDPHTVIGLSLPLLRLMLAAAGVQWSSLWHIDR